MPDMIIFGAGASFGSDIFNVPPPTNHLIDELISFQPHSWGQIDSRLLSLFREDFEEGMKKLSEKNPRSMAPLRRSMAEFFFRFAPGPDNLYRKLARRIRQSGWDGVLATFNYERLLELSLIFEGLQPVAGAPQTTNHIEVCLPHGCCHLFRKSVRDSTSVISFNGRAIRIEGPVRPVFEPNEFRARICDGAFPPVMNYFDREKSTTSGASFIAAQRSRFKEAVLSCSRIAIIGLKVRPQDRHIWGPLARTSGRLIYCSRETAAKRFKDWAKKRRSGGDKVFNGDFDGHFDDICNELDIGTGISSAARKASSRAKAKKRVMAYAKAREETEAKAQAEARPRAEAEEKARAETQEKIKSYAGEIAKIKAKVAETIANQRAKSEAEAAKTIASVKAAAVEAIARVKAGAEETIAEQKARTESETRLRAEPEEKIKSYAGEIAKIKAKAAETIANQRAKSEAEATKTIARLKDEAEQKTRAYTNMIAKVKTGAEEIIARVKTGAEEAIARVKTGVKETVVEQKAKAESEVRPRAETQEKTKSYAGEIAKIKAEAAEAIANQRAKSEAEVARTIARVKAAAVDGVAEVKAKFEEKSRLDAKAKAAETVSDSFGGAMGKKHVGPTIRKKLPLNSIGALLAIRAKDITQKDIVWGTGDDSVEHALTKMQECDTGYMMIGRDGVLEGIVSKSDLTGALSPYLRRTFAKWHQPLDDATLQIKIKWIMSRPVQTIRSDTSLAVIMKNMHRSDGRCLPVVNEQGKVEGLVTVFDILKALLKSSPNISISGKTLRVPPLLAKLKTAAESQKPADCLDTAYVPC